MEISCVFDTKFCFAKCTSKFWYPINFSVVHLWCNNAVTLPSSVLIVCHYLLQTFFMFCSSKFSSSLSTHHAKNFGTVAYKNLANRHPDQDSPPHDQTIITRFTEKHAWVILYVTTNAINLSRYCYVVIRGMCRCSWLRHCATRWKVRFLMVSLDFFIDIFWPHCGLGADSPSNRN